LNLYDFQWAGDASAIIITVLALILGITAALHALLTKQDPRSALGWVAVCLGIPFVGPFFYLIFGFNRIQTRVRKWRMKGRWARLERGLEQKHHELFALLSADTTKQSVLERVRRLSDAVTRRPLVGGCKVDILSNGDEAYDAMLQSIRNAKKFVYMTSYIFDPGKSADAFIQAMGDAKKRGVDVRLLADGIGTFYTWLWNLRRLKKAKIKAVRFLPVFTSKGGLNINLRNHRKILVVDGEVGFTGGMNVSDDHCPSAGSDAMLDHHFRLEGPIVYHLTDVFLEDWYFSTGENDPTVRPMSSSHEPGSAYCRGVAAGPNEEFAQLHWIYLGVISAAAERVTVVTPYLVPDVALSAALETAALRGVKVDVIVPARTDGRIVDWASRAYHEQLLNRGVRIHEIPEFMHSKILLVDDFYSLIGSANVDARSFLLNFEFNVEVYDFDFNARLSRVADQLRAKSRDITLQEVRDRPFLARVRDSFFKLFSPYL
jgi:cardiolipin synthase